METDTFPKDTVQKALGRMVAAKVNKGAAEKAFKKHGGKGVPLLVLLDPTGKERARCDGKPPDVMESFAGSLWNKGVELSKEGKKFEAFQEWYPIILLFGENDLAKQAQSSMAGWDSDPELKAKMDELKAKWVCEPAIKKHDRLTKTRGKVDPKLMEESKAELERVVADFAGTPYATQAQERLDKLAKKK